MVTRDQFLDFEEVRQSGKYNMVTQADRAMAASYLDPEDYREILNNYSMYKSMYLK